MILLFKKIQIIMRHVIIKVKISIYFWGRALQELHSYDDAIIMYDNVIQINPYHAQAYYQKRD